MYYLWFLLIGLVAGWLASLLVKGHGSGLLLNLIIGVIGSFIGGWILSLFGLFAIGTAGSLIAAIIGAIVLLWIASAISNTNAKNKHKK